MHGWIPTYASLCRQGREPSSICPQCQSTVETKEHVLICPSSEATHHWTLLLNTQFWSMRLKVKNQVMSLYKCPPKLNSSYRKIKDVPLSERLSQNTSQLQQWLWQIDHQIKSTKYIAATKENTQMSIHTYCGPRSFTRHGMTACANTLLREKNCFYGISAKVFPLLKTSFLHRLQLFFLDS